MGRVDHHDPILKIYRWVVLALPVSLALVTYLFILHLTSLVIDKVDMYTPNAFLLGVDHQNMGREKG